MRRPDPLRLPCKLGIFLALLERAGSELDRPRHPNCEDESSCLLELADLDRLVAVVPGSDLLRPHTCAFFCSPIPMTGSKPECPGDPSCEDGVMPLFLFVPAGLDPLEAILPGTDLLRFAGN